MRESKLCPHCKLQYLSIDRHLPTCIKIFSEFSVEEFISDYETGLTLTELGIKYHSDFSYVHRLLKKLGIKPRSFSEAAKIPRSKIKREITSLELYGVKHMFSKGSPIKDKIQENLAKEGIVNVFQRESVKKKIVETLMNKYGVSHPMQYIEVQEKIKNTYIEKFGFYSPCRSGNSKKSFNYSSVHKKIVEFLTHNNITCEIEYRIVVKKRVYYFDIIISNTNKLIEIHGDYWHCNPIKYKADNVVKFPSGYKKVEEVWLRDLNKANAATDMGYVVLVLWEYDIKKNLSKVKNEILNFLK